MAFNYFNTSFVWQNLLNQSKTANCVLQFIEVEPKNTEQKEKNKLKSLITVNIYKKCGSIKAKLNNR